MANWTNFLAKFSGSYLTIAEQLRDDSAITNVEQFHQLRSLAESGLSDKLAALTSTGVGFLHEWATFIDTEKGDVATGTQANEPVYSDAKWTALKAEFLSEYGDTIDGLRNDIKHSDLPSWTEFVADFTADYQPLITEFSNDGAFGYNTINDFLPISTGVLKDQIDNLNSTSGFINELATLLNTKKAGLDGNSTWTDFRNNFSTEWQPMITKLELDFIGMSWATFYGKTVGDHKTDLVNDGDQAYLELAQVLIDHRDADWERFKALSLTGLRDKLADLDADSEFFSGYTQVISDEMDDLVNLYDKMVPEFEEGERTVVADMLEYMQSTANTTGIEFNDFIEEGESSIGKHLTIFMNHASGAAFVTHYATTIKNAATTAFADCINTDERIQKFYEELTSGMLQNFNSFFDTMLANGTITSYENISESEVTIASIETDLKDLPCSHPFVHSQAKFVDEVAQGMIPQYTYSYALHVKLVDTEIEAQPFTDMTVELQDTTTSEVLSQSTTADDGRVFLRYEILHEKQTLPETQTFDVVVKDSDDSVFHTESDVTATVDSLTATTISVARPAIPEPDSSDITDIFIDHPTVTLPTDLNNFLTPDFVTLFNIREIGGLENHLFGGAVDDTDADVIAAVELIDQHAGLDTLNPEQIVLNQNLIDNSYTSVNKITRTPLVIFKSDTSIYLTDEEATNMYNQAKALQNVNNNIIASLIVGDQYQEPANFGASGNIWNEDWEEIKRKLDVKYQAQCTVNENESAVSPLAYLYDLIEYITTNIQDDTTSLDIAYLETNLYQRFSDLVGSADSVDTKISNVRALVEILRKYLVDASITVSSTDLKSYLERAYVFLLSQLNMGYSELSKAAKADAKNQTEFADEYNIETSLIPDIYFDIKADPTTLSEESLAEYFGLIDSTQPPLSIGTKITSTDGNDTLEEWSFKDISHELNTDSDGYLFVKIDGTLGSPNTYLLEVFKASGSGAANKVAEGSLSTTQLSGIVYLKPISDSGLTGYIKFNYTSDDADIKISVIPKFIASRLSVAKTTWKELDEQIVLIDPDLVNPEDFINPYDLSSGAGQLWNDRKIELEGALTTISGLPGTNDDTTAHDTTTSFESIALIDDTIFTVDSSGEIGVIYNGTDATFSTGGTGIINTNGDNVYLPDGGDASIKRYTTSGTYHEAAGTPRPLTYTDGDSDNYQFKDMTWKTNGNLIVGAIDTVKNEDLLIEMTPATASKYKGGHITWDSSGNAYVLNAAEPSILKIDASGEVVASYGYKVDNPARHYKLDDDTITDEIVDPPSTGSGSGLDEVTGKFGTGAVQTNGLNSYIKTHDVLSTDADAFSVSFWAKPHQVTSNEAQLLLSLSDSTRNMGLSVYLEKGNLYATHWYYDSSEEVYTRAPIALEAKNALTAGAWHHIALSVEGNTTETEKVNGIKLYIDGNLSGSLPATLFDADLEVYMGGLNSGVQVRSHHFDPDVQDYVLHTQENGCRAVFDEVKIFHRVITPSDVEGLYDDTTTGVLVGPKAMTLSPLGEVYVLDSTDDKVKIFNNEGSFLSEIAFQDVDPSDDFHSIALDSAGNIYVSDLIGKGPSGNGQVRIFNSDGVEQDALFAYDGTAFLYVYAVHVDAYERLFVAQYDPSTSNPLSKIHVFDLSSGSPIKETQITQDLAGATIKRPTAICSDAYGNVYVADTNQDRIIQFDKSLNPIVQWGHSDNFMFDAIPTIESFGSLSISNQNELFFGNGAVLTADFTLYQTRMPKKVAIDGGSLRSIVSNRQDEIFISHGSKTSRYNPKERSFTQICDSGMDEGEVNTPKQLAIDGFERIYVADSGNSRVQMIDREGNFIRNLNSFLSGSDDFVGTSAVAVSSYLEVFAGGTDGTDSILFQFDINKGLAALLKEDGFLELSAQNVGDLEAEEADGQDISTDLETYGLTLPAFRYLSEVMKATIGLDEEAWENVFNISVQAYKTKEASTWIGEEVAAGVYLTPSQFRQHLENKYEEPRSFTPWRASYLERLEWEERLNDRYELIASIHEAHRQRLSETDKECLSLLRDALIDKTSSSGSLESKTQGLSDDLLIDLKNESHSQTTRVAVAIETLQSLVWRLRTGQLENSFADLNNIDDDFDAAWKWRSSYKTWKSAQFVNLFPENLLFPEIKPNQTQAFQKLVEQLNNNPYITPEDACALSNEYAEYIKDISNFDQVIGTFGEKYSGNQGPCGNFNPTDVSVQTDDNGNLTTPKDRIPVIYFFGLHKPSGKVYYATYEYMIEEELSEFSDISSIVSDWKIVPGIDTATDLSASISYPKQSKSDYKTPFKNLILYVILNDSGQSKPSIVTLDLTKNEWLKPKNIKLPSELKGEEITFLIGDDIGNETQLTACKHDVVDKFYFAKLNGAGSQKADVDWTCKGPFELLIPSEKDGYLFKFVHDTKDDIWSNINPGGGYTKARGTRPETIKKGKIPITEAVPLKIIARHAAGKAVVFEDADEQGKFYISYNGFLNTGRSGKKRTQLVEFNTGKLVNPTIESFFRWQDKNEYYMAIFVDENNRRYYDLLKLDVDWNTKTILGTRISDGAWVYGNIHSAILSPESQDRAIFNINSPLKEYGAMTINKESGGSYNFSKIWGTWNSASYDDLGKISFLSMVRTITPNNYVGPRYFGASLKPIQQSTQKRVSILTNSYKGITQAHRKNLANYFEEAYYYLPMVIAEKLQRNGYYEDSLDWYRLVYDFKEGGNPKVFPRLKNEENKSYAISNIGPELNDLQNPHTIARTRDNAFSRYTVAAIARSLIEYADREFTADTSESIAKAFSLYEKAIEVLSQIGFNNVMSECELAIENIDDSKTKESGFAPWIKQWKGLKVKLLDIKTFNLDDIADTNDLKGAIEYTETRLGNTGTINTSSDSDIALKLTEIETRIDEILTVQGKALDFDTLNAFELKWVPFLGITLPLLETGELRLNYNFALPRNPVKDYLMMYAEVNLFKMRNGMNIAGMVRSLDVYATSPDTTTGMSFVGIGGQIVNTGATYAPTQTQYHYKVLLERAKQLAQIAGQMEGSMLGALEKYDAERYSIKRAEQDLALAEESMNTGA